MQMYNKPKGHKPSIASTHFDHFTLPDPAAYQVLPTISCGISPSGYRKNVRLTCLVCHAIPLKI